MLDRSSYLPPAYRVVAVFRDAKSADNAKSRLGNPSESTFAPVIGTLGWGEAGGEKGGGDYFITYTSRLGGGGGGGIRQCDDVYILKA